MKKAMSIKNRLISAVLVLVMTFTSLIGTTFAWFTDTVTSVGNTIESGTLKVDLLHKDGDDWISLKENEDHLVFDYKKWEPGFTLVETLKVQNLGSLALKYKLSIEVEAGTAKLGKNGENLADVIDVWVYYGETTATGYGDITAANSGWVKKGTLTEVFGKPGEFMSGNLLPTGNVSNDANVGVGNQIVNVALHMQESAGNEYQKLSVGNIYVNLVATQLTSESDSFGSDYDTDAIFPELNISGIYADVVVEDGKVAEAVSITGIGVNANIPEGVVVESNNTSKVGLSVIEKEASDANITLNDGEALRSLDVHIAGISKDNTIPMFITVEQAMKPGLNIGNYTLYHVEDGVTVAMTSVNSIADLDVHNEFYYDPATGDVTLAMATFSEVAFVAEPSKWEGNRDYSWYTGAVATVDGEGNTVYTIANADQLAGFSAIVGNMAEGIEQDSFSGKTVKLIADINLGDKESENNPDIIFYPIGYWNNEGTYERKPLEERTTAVESGFYTFEGTFDGNGHTISNFYQNTWEMKGDHNWYDPIKEQYYRDGMGLFGKIYKGTVKNLTVKNFSSDGEIATTGVIASYAEGSTFENIAIFNCNPRVYNIGNGGIVGCVGWYAKEAGLITTFKNITVDNTNKISALWGSYDVPCGGILGQYYPTSGQTSAGTPANGGLSFENCHVSAQLDVYNDVCGNYQYYAYRYAGMLIGSVRENVTIDGHSYPKMDGIEAKNCTVHFGTWNDYYYCEIIDNTTASYTHDYQMSRLTEIKAIDGTTITYLDGTTGTVPASGRANYVIVDYSKGHGTENATCYHFKNGEVWNHSDAGTEIVNGVEVLVEDKQHLYLEFNNLVTGYGWGVTTKGVGDVDGVTILDREVADSVEKFKSVIDNNKEFATESTVTIGDLFAAIENAGVDIKSNNVQVTVSPFGATSTAGGTYVANTTDWTQGTITFSGIGQAVITITDYYFCKTTSITVNVVGTEKFDTNFVNYKDYLYRVGNADESTVALGTIFKHSGKGTINSDNVSVAFETIGGNASGTYTSNTSDWTKGTIQFTGTGVVKVTIKDDTSKEFVLNLEVVDAVNATGATSATSYNVVLLNNAGLSSMTVSGRYTFYGNGFTLTYSGDGRYLNNGLKQGVVTVSENGMLDNVRIIAPIYPTAFMYYGNTTYADFVQQSSNPREEVVKDGKISYRYYYQLSAVVANGNATISNCYIYGGRTNVFVDTGDVTIKDTVLECGTVANVQIQSNSSHTITLGDVTTIQYQVNATIGDTSKIMLGAGVIVGPDTNDNPKIVLNGSLKQYNWVTEEDEKAVSSSIVQMIIDKALGSTDYNHTINGKTASNLGIVYMNKFDVDVENNTGLPYKSDVITMTGVDGQVYSLQNATEDQIYSDYVNADKSTVNGWYQPQFKYDSTLGGQDIPDDGGDEFLYREGDTIKVLFPSGDSKEIDLAKLINIVKYSGQNLGLEISVKDGQGNAVNVTDGKVVLSTAGIYTVTYTVTDTLFYDKDAKIVTRSESYSWNVTVDVSLKDTKIPNAYYEFDTSKQKMGYYKPSIGDVKQYIPFLAGLKIYDYNGQTSYLRFNGDSDFNKVASITVTNKYSGNDALVVVKLTDGGTITLQLLARADSGGGSTYTGTIKTSNNIIYYVNDGGTSNKDSTTTAAYWYVDYYKFTGNNGVEITSGQQKFTSTGSSASTPSGSFSTSIKYTVTYDANNGNCGQTVGYATSAATAVTLPTPTRSGYIFAGWYTAASGGTRVGGAGESYTPSANITLYAQWGKPCDVTYNANGGNCGTTSEKYTGTALTLPTPTRDGYWFIGWYDAAEGGNKIGDAGAKYNPTNEITLYAHWQEAIEYTVTYNANGGSVSPTSATYQGTALTLPTPTKEGHTFSGWYTAASGGTKIGDAGSTYLPSANITVYAQWKINSYKIEVSISNATVVINGTSYTASTNLTIEYDSDVTVKLDSFSQSSNKKFSISGTSADTSSTTTGKTYTFKMPAGNVTIEASSSGSCVTPDTLITLADGTQVRIDALTGTEELLVWNHETGKLEKASIAYIVNHEMVASEYEIIHLNFANGKTVKIIEEHVFFDATLNKYVAIDSNNVDSFIGHTFIALGADGISVERVELVSVNREIIETEVYEVVSYKHLTCFTDGILTTSAYLDPLLNVFDIDNETLAYDAESVQRDIETYGLYTYADFEELISEEAFELYNAAYLKIAVGKGYITWDDILDLIDIYFNAGVTPLEG